MSGNNPQSRIKVTDLLDNCAPVLPGRFHSANPEERTLMMHAYNRLPFLLTHIEAWLNSADCGSEVKIMLRYLHDRLAYVDADETVPPQPQLKPDKKDEEIARLRNELDRTRAYLSAVTKIPASQLKHIDELPKIYMMLCDPDVKTPEACQAIVQGIPPEERGKVLNAVIDLKLRAISAEARLRKTEADEAALEGFLNELGTVNLADKAEEALNGFKPKAPATKLAALTIELVDRTVKNAKQRHDEIGRVREELYAANYELCRLRSLIYTKSAEELRKAAADIRKDTPSTASRLIDILTEYHAAAGKKDETWQLKPALEILQFVLEEHQSYTDLQIQARKLKEWREVNSGKSDLLSRLGRLISSYISARTAFAENSNFNAGLLNLIRESKSLVSLAVAAGELQKLDPIGVHDDLLCAVLGALEGKFALEGKLASIRELVK